MTIYVPVTAQAVLRLAVPHAVVPAAVAFAFVAPFVATSVAGPLRDDERGLQLLCPAGPVAKAVSTQMKAAVADASTLLQCCKFDVSLPVGEAKAKEIVAALKEYTPKAEVKKLWRTQRTDAAKAMAELERHIASIFAADAERVTVSCDPSKTSEYKSVITLPHVTKKRGRGADAKSREITMTVTSNRCLDDFDTSVALTSGQGSKQVRTFTSFGREHIMPCPFELKQIGKLIDGTSTAELLSDKGAAALFIAWGSVLSSHDGLWDMFASDLIRDLKA